MAPSKVLSEGNDTLSSGKQLMFCYWAAFSPVKVASYPD
jgi:hypothetical protein